MLFTEKLNVKRARHGGPIVLHQDFPYWEPLTPVASRIATAMVFLDDATIDNGCLEVAPGTHKVGKWPQRTDADGFGSLEMDPAAFDLGRLQPLEVPAGDGGLLRRLPRAPFAPQPHRWRPPRPALLLPAGRPAAAAWSSTPCCSAGRRTLRAGRRNDRPDFGPPPSSTFDIAPTPDEIAAFEAERLPRRRAPDHRRGAGLAAARSSSSSSIPPTPANAAGQSTGRGRTGGGEPSRLGQAFFPEMQFPAILTSTFHRNAKRYAAALLGVDAGRLTCWGHMIRQAAGRPRGLLAPGPRLLAAGAGLLRAGRLAAAARRDRRDGRDAVHARLAPARPLRPSPRGRSGAQPAHRGRTRRRRAAVACPLKAGGATFHHAETLHYTAPNTSERPRLAFPMEFQLKPVRRAIPEVMPWVDEHRAAVGPQPLVHVGDGKVSRL